MDQIKIGNFIAQCRKSKDLTQTQLANKLGITNRAVSKWETGKSLPDASIMLALCRTLEITVNDLLCGEAVNMENYNKEMEKNLMELVRQKQESDRWLLRFEIILGVVVIAVMLALCFIAAYVPMETWLRITLVVAGLVPVLVATPFMLCIEQKAGYYVCAKCGHHYVPSYKSVFFAQHMGRTRHLRCPKCNEKSWQKKVLTKE